jgi:NTE family protein
MFRRKIGIALGGGGARGAAHIGVLEHLTSIGLDIHCISGTSAGAIIATMYAFGVDFETMKRELKQVNPTPFASIKIGKLGLFENTEMMEMLKRLLPPNAQIENALTPLTIKATDLITGEGVLLSHGDVIGAVMASSCVPGFYLPLEMNNMILVDGGLTENVPLSGLKFHGANLLIGVNLNGNTAYTKPNGILDVVSNAMDIAIDVRTKKQLKEADAAISIDLTEFSRTSSRDFDRLVLEGHKASLQKIPTVSSLYFQNRFMKMWKMIKEITPVKIPEKIQRIFKRDDKERIPKSLTP